MNPDRLSRLYRIVALPNGARCIRSVADAETMHPGIGPAAEASALYVDQLRLVERIAECAAEFVVWDVGLGAAANAIAVMKSLLRHRSTASTDSDPPHEPRFGVPRLRGRGWRTETAKTNGPPEGGTPSDLSDPGFNARTFSAPRGRRVRLVSFDHTDAALAFALQHRDELGYLAGFESTAAALLQDRHAQISGPGLDIEWTFEVGDFPTSLAGRRAAPQAILFDPYSPKKNPAMWTVQLFADLFRQLDPQRPCVLATFSRSTMARTAMLLGGFYVGAGHPSGLKEETTVAANRRELLDQPLDGRWLERARRSGSAEPLREPVYRQAPLSDGTWQELRRHPQFAERRAG